MSSDAAPALTVDTGPPLTGQQPGRRLHWVSPFLSFVRSPRQLLLTVWLIVQGELGIVGWLTIAGLAIQVASWWRRTYAVAGGELRIDEGILARRHRSIPLERIQEVNLIRQFRHRLLGLATLDVQTAAHGQDSRVRLSVLTRSGAEALRDELLGARAGTGALVGDAGDVVFTLSNRDLVIAGLTANKWAAVGLGFAAWKIADDLPASIRPSIDLGRGVLGGWIGVIVAGLAAVAVLAAAAIWSSVTRNAGFSLVRHGGELRVRRGLLDRHEVVVPRERTQFVRMQQTPSRRWLGIASLRLVTAGEGSGSQNLAIPVVKLADLPRLVGELLPGCEPLPELRPAEPRARRRYVRSSVLRWGLVASALAAAGVLEGEPWLVATIPVGVALGWWLGVKRFRALGHALVNGVLHTRRGGLTTTTDIVPLVKAQGGDVTSSWFERRVGLGKFRVHVARGSCPVPGLDVGLAEELLAITTTGSSHGLSTPLGQT